MRKNPTLFARILLVLIAVFLMFMVFTMVNCTPNTTKEEAIEILKKTEEKEKYQVSEIDTKYGRIYDKVNGSRWHISEITYDSCEYIKFEIPRDYYVGYGYAAHKGNCKYCHKRDSLLIMSCLESLEENGKSPTNQGKQ